MKIIEVFRTNVEQAEEASLLIEKLMAHFPYYKINFDLQDCDRILRVAGNEISPEKIMELVSTHGYHCEVLS